MMTGNRTKTETQKIIEAMGASPETANQISILLNLTSWGISGWKLGKAINASANETMAAIKANQLAKNADYTQKNITNVTITEYKIGGLFEPVPIGANLIGKNDPLATAATLIKPQDGYFDVVIHGTSESFGVLRNGQWINLDQRSLTTFIQKNNYNGESIRLISCSTGACSTSIAQDLSNKLGAKVIAPSNTIWIHPNGNMTIGDNPLINNGKWNTFKPGENLK